MKYQSRLIALTIGFVVACTHGPAPPPTRVEPVTDTLHGVELVDDYRWLETEQAPETREWIAAQNDYAEQIIGETPARQQLRTRLRELMDREASISGTRKAGDFEYFTMRRVGEERAAIYRRPAAEDDDSGEADEPTAEGDYEVVIDPHEIDPTSRTPVAMVDFSPDGGLMMYSIRQGGADEIEVRIRDLETGEDLADRLPDALYSGLDFDDDGTGFYYTARSRTEGPRIRHHTLGEPMADDKLIWGDGYPPTTFIGRDRIKDTDWTIFTVQHGWARNDLFIQLGSEPVRPIVENVPAHFQHRYRDGKIYVRTDWQAPLYRLMEVDPARPDPDNWNELIAETDAVLESYSFIDERIYVTYLRDVANEIRIFESDGTPAGSIDVPRNSSASIRSGDKGKAILSVRGYLTPTTEYELDLGTGERTVTEPADVEFDRDAYQLSKIWFDSSGGVRAPIHVMHRKDITLDGSHPTILNGYGGFNVSIKPGFSTTRLAWLELGGVYAVATLRGGSEFGEEWHADGMLTRKQHVFDDFIAAAEKLISGGFTSPDKLAISGGSNGGLLVASAMTQRPELFRAVLCTYPDLDMVRFFSFTEDNNMPALLEYGDARIREQFEAIVGYSPYQAVRDGGDYPAVLFTTGDLDTRVPPHQARKMTARLQAATSSGRPVLLWYDERGGHAAGRGRPLSMTIEDNARQLAFLATQLGLEIEPVQ